MIDLNNHKLELEYPCSWCYKIVIKEEHIAEEITKEVFNKREHKVTKSKSSSKGKFVSFNIDLVVHNDEDRKYFHEALSKHKQIKMVI